ncbi:MAG: IS1380 family transposase [Alphaproteobacteria bacterium]|nr:IS1380 family transposase [Alphaproteobacteria bacterium]
MAEHSLLPFDLPAVASKKVRVAFDGGKLTSDAGVLLLREVEKKLGIADRLAGCLRDRRDRSRIDHTIAEMLRFRMFAIAAGYEDGDDCDALRDDPAFKMAVGRAPASGDPLCSQPTMSRLENAPSRIGLIRMMAAMVDLFCDSWAQVPRRIVLDIDDTWDETHGAQQLSLFNAHYDGYGFLPIHLYEATSGKPVAAILRPGKTPSGTEVRAILKHVIGRIRKNWPRVEVLVRGDSHYARPEALDWLEDEGFAYAFGLSGNAALQTLAAPFAEGAAVRRALAGANAKVRRYAAFAYAARSWHRSRRVVARAEASEHGSDVRFVVTNLAAKPKRLYERVFCARGQMENLIKAHKTHLASDRTSCHDARANQFRLVLHSAAYWLLHDLRAAAPRRSFWRSAQFDTLRLRLIKLAARVNEKATVIRLALASACPDKAIFAHLATVLVAQGP